MLLAKYVPAALKAFLIGFVLSYLLGYCVDYIPYIMAVTIAVAPVYGLIRALNEKVSDKTVSLRKMLKAGSKYLKDFTKAIIFYGSLIVAAWYLRSDLIHILLKALLGGLVAFGAMLVIWEIARFILKIIKKVEIPSYFSAFKSAI